MNLSFLFEPLLSVASIALAIWLFARRLPWREDFGRRALGSGLLLVAVCIGVVDILRRAANVPLGVYQAESPSSVGWFVSIFATFSIVLVLALLFVRFLCVCNLRAAAFCVTAGYTMQNLASGTDTFLRIVLDRIMPVSVHPVAYIAGILACYAAVYALVNQLFIRRVDGQAAGRGGKAGMLTILAVIFAVIGFDVIIKSLMTTSMPTTYLLALRLFHGAVCAFLLFSEYEVLYNTNLKVEVATTERLLADQEHQYQQSLLNVDAINMKCHDIRHQIRALRDGVTAVDGAVLDDIAREVNVYDSRVKTGNEALDTILSEKSLLCQREGIALTCIANGTCLMFMPAAELYAFFGNALDNAIEATRKIPELDERNISLDVRERLGMASIHIENRYEGTLEFKDGLPVTTKDDRANHGFGTRSMRETVTRHGGTFTTSAKDGVFQLNALIPIPDDWAAKLV